MSKVADQYRATAKQMLAGGDQTSVNLALSIQIMALEADMAELQGRVEWLEASADHREDE